MNYTYIVQCADGTLYTGWTNCLQKRLKAHNEGKAGAKYTRSNRPNWSIMKALKQKRKQCAENMRSNSLQENKN